MPLIARLAAVADDVASTVLILRADLPLLPVWKSRRVAVVDVAAVVTGGAIAILRTTVDGYVSRLLDVSTSTDMFGAVACCAVATLLLVVTVAFRLFVFDDDDVHDVDIVVLLPSPPTAVLFL